MARRKTKSRTLNLTARSEQRKGFTMPTMKKIKSVLRKRSKTFLVSLIMSMFSKLSKTQKISMLMRIDRKSIGRKRKAKRKSSTRGRRKAPKRRTSRRKSKGRRKGRTARQRAATRKLVAFNKKRRR